MDPRLLSWDWSFEPAVMLGVVVAIVLYWRGVRYSIRAGLARHLSGWRFASFAGALLSIVLALESPLDIWSDTYLWAHMLQHMLLIFAAPPLLLLGLPVWPVWRAIPLSARRDSLRWVMRRPKVRRPLFWLMGILTTPRVVWVLFIADFLAWHVPALYDLALQYQSVHDLEHLLFLGTSILFWAQIIPSMPLEPRLGYLMRGLYLFAAGIAMSMVSMIYVYFPTPLYAHYAAVARPVGAISAIVDQDAAGAIMDIVGGFTIAIVFMVLLWLWLDEDEKRTAALGQTPSVSQRAIQ